MFSCIISRGKRKYSKYDHGRRLGTVDPVRMELDCIDVEYIRATNEIDNKNDTQKKVSDRISFTPIFLA